MKLEYDHDADAAYLLLSSAQKNVVRSDEVAPGIVVDYDGDNHVIGIEVLDVSRHMPEYEHVEIAASRPRLRTAGVDA